jgi:excisionase family DNA binding protein
MAVNIVTKEDLLEFKHEFFQHLETVLKARPEKPKKWIKSSEVAELLNISSGTLQNLRINGTLTFSKIGGTLFYNYDDIEALLDGKKA